MFRGRSSNGEVQEFTEAEMQKFLDRVTEFNKEAMKNSVNAVEELKKDSVIKQENEFQAVLAMFDKLGFQTFSVVNSHATTGMADMD